MINFKYDKNDFRLGKCYDNVYKVCRMNEGNLNGNKVAIGFIIFKYDGKMCILRHCYIIDECGTVILDTTYNISPETKDLYGYINLAILKPKEFMQKWDEKNKYKEDKFFSDETYKKEFYILERLGVTRFIGSKLATTFKINEQLFLNLIYEFIDTYVK